jgi:WD40 repeat protein
MSTASSLIRLFVSSTFSDFVLEREVLQQDVFPRLRTLCESEGCRFQPVDLRWGVSEEAANEKRTLAICLEEIVRCQRISPDLNLLILLGERYGSCFLPERIPSLQFARLMPHLSPTEREQAGTAYAEDRNAAPAEYVLLPARSAETVPAQRLITQRAEESLRAALAQAAGAAGFSPEEILPYTASATHLEIQRGLLDTMCDPSATIAIFRTQPTAPNESRDVEHIEPNPERQAQLQALKIAVERRLGGRIWRYPSMGESFERHVDQAHRRASALAEQFYALLEPRIREALLLRKSATSERDVIAEVNQRFAETHTSVVIGRESALRAVTDYVAGATTLPLIVTGPLGVGKSTLLAQAVKQVTSAHPNSVIVTRYVGITPGTTTLSELLSGVRSEVAVRYGQPSPEPIGDLSQLVAIFASELGTWEIPAERPLIVFLDALDQLGSRQQRVDWLPLTLAPNIHAIVSIAAGRDELANLHTRLPDEQFLFLDWLTREEGREVLRTWLSAEGRRLTPEQETVILNGFASEGPKHGGGTPLYLRLASEQARTWRSFDANQLLPSTVSALVQSYFADLERSARHGPELVAYAMGGLAAARHGLAEDELLDLLARNEAIREGLHRLSPNAPLIDAAQPLPFALWARLAADLERYLADREADGVLLLTFYHRQVLEEAERRYLDGTNRATRHRELATYFGGQPYQLDAGTSAIWNRRKLAELAYHEAKAGPIARSDLETTLTDGRFLLGKVTIEGVTSVLDELAFASDDDGVARIALAMRAGALALTNEPQELSNQIRGRVGHVGKLHDLPQRTPPRLDLRSRSLDADPALLHILQGHTSEVTACAISSDGRFALTGAADGTLRLWDTNTGETVRMMQGSRQPIVACALSADGALALFSAGSLTLHLWNAASGERLHALYGHGDKVTDCALSADGRRALSSSWDRTLRVWDTVNGDTLRVLIGHKSRVANCALSADGRVALSTATNGSVRLWDVESGRTLHTRRELADIGGCALSADGRVATYFYGNPFQGSAVSAYGMRTALRMALLTAIHGEPLAGAMLMTNAGARAKLCVWDTATGRIRSNLRSYGALNACALNEVGRMILTASGSPYFSVGAAMGQLGPLQSLKSSSGDFDDFEGATLRLRDADSGRTLRVMKGHKGAIADCALSATGELAVSIAAEEAPFVVAAGEQKAPRVWNTATRITLPEQDKHGSIVTRCALSVDGKIALTASIDRTLRVWDTRSGQTAQILRGHAGPVLGCALSADGRMALSASRDGTVRLWNTGTGDTLQTHRFDFPGNDEFIYRCSLSDNGHLAFSPRMASVQVWDLTSGRTLLQFQPSSRPAATLVSHVGLIQGRYALSGNGERAFAVSEDGWLRIWDTATGKMLGTLVGQAENMAECSASVSGERIALAAVDQPTIWVWNTTNSEPVYTLQGHTAEVVACAISADGRKALSASHDRTLRVWNLDYGRESAVWSHDVILFSCALSADGRTAMTGDVDGGVHFFDVVDGAET